MIYVTLPEEFVAIKYQGYFWHLGEQKLYSLKIGGELKRMKTRSFYINWNHQKFKNKRGDKVGEPCYTLSVNGKRKQILVEDLMMVTPKETKIKVMSKNV